MKGELKVMFAEHSVCVAFRRKGNEIGYQLTLELLLSKAVLVAFCRKLERIPQEKMKAEC
ncbi:hypothetical protein [Dapis sp. BLCC M229]|uniref:hypothetical protein n=1 Tax=Dapis sp. BLCC M229 TaxID=3400188 RepID=UPI003CF03BC3